jgi:hypothetical protein
MRAHVSGVPIQGRLDMAAPGRERQAELAHPSLEVRGCGDVDVMAA